MTGEVERFDLYDGSVLVLEWTGPQSYRAVREVGGEAVWDQSVTWPAEDAEGNPDDERGRREADHLIAMVTKVPSAFQRPGVAS